MKVRDVIRLIRADGWALVRTRGSHRQFKHPIKPGLVTIAGKPGDDLALGTLASVLKRVEMKNGYLIVIEKVDRHYSAYAPDLPGCVATGSTAAEARRNMHAALELHVQGLREEGLPIPKPLTRFARIAPRRRSARSARDARSARTRRAS